MANNKKIKVELSSLPARSEKLSDDDIDNVFGGCGGQGSICEKNDDCCGKLVCYINWPFSESTCDIDNSNWP